MACTCENSWKCLFTSGVHHLSFILLFWGPLVGHGSPISSPERHRTAPRLDDGHGGAPDPSLIEQDSEVDVQNLLETVRGQFLRTFNLSGHRFGLEPGGQKVEPPEYMLELYNRFANDRTSMPSANIVRSFENEESSPSLVDPDGVRRHALIFNISIPHHERVTAAELRLYTLVQTDRHLYAGVDRKVTVYEVVQRNDTWAWQEKDDGAASRLAELASRQVYGTGGAWETFDMTAAVQHWRSLDYDTTHRLEVHIESLNSHNSSELEGPRTDGDMDIDTDPGERHKPLIIVFSNDQSTDHRGERQEVNEMIKHEVPGPGPDDNLDLELEDLWGELGTMGHGDSDEAALLQMRSNLIYETASRIRRNAKGNQCKKTSLYVDFKDIGWDSWILEPQGYEAYKCTGVCTYPMTNDVTPTKHAIVQMLASLKSPKTVSRACCVPTKLDPISLLYLDDSGVVTYQYKYEGMVVAECGCR